MRFEVSIYQILFYEKPQELIDLDSLNKKRYKVGISRLPEPEQPVRFDYQGEEDIAREMEKAPSRSRE